MEMVWKNRYVIWDIWNHNPGFLIDGFSNNTEFFDKIEEKEKEEKEKIKKENLKKNQGIKK